MWLGAGNVSSAGCSFLRGYLANEGAAKTRGGDDAKPIAETVEGKNGTNLEGALEYVKVYESELLRFKRKEMSQFLHSLILLIDVVKVTLTA